METFIFKLTPVYLMLMYFCSSRTKLSWLSSTAALSPRSSMSELKKMTRLRSTSSVGSCNQQWVTHQNTFWSEIWQRWMDRDETGKSWDGSFHELLILKSGNCIGRLCRGSDCCSSVMT